VVVAFRAGAFTQANEAEAGVPHLIEHMIFKAAGATWSSQLSNFGAGYNGMTTAEMVAYYAMTPATNTSKVVKLMADLVRGPKFEARDLVTEAKVVRNELERHVANPEDLLYFTVNQNLWTDASFRKDPGGNVLAVQSANAPLIQGLYQHFYVPNNAALVVSGDIVIADVFTAAKQAFAGWKKVPAALPTLKITPMTATRAVNVDAKVADATIRISWQGPSAHDDSTGAMTAELFAAMVNSRNSAFQRNLVDEGFFQSVQADYELLNNVGPIVVVAKTTPDKLVAGAAALQRELARLADPQAFTEEDLRLAKKAWTLDAAREWETGPQLAVPVAHHWAIAGFKSYVGYREGIGARTPADLRQFLDKYIAGKPKSVGVMTSTETRLALGADFQRMMAAWGAK
jgi:zinc protease